MTKENSAKAHQRLIREREAEAPSLLGPWWEEVDISLEKASIQEISIAKAEEIILRYEWLGTMPIAIKRCYGFFHSGVLAGAAVFAEKPGASLKSDKHSIVPADAWYLARGACVHWAHPHAASWMIAHIGKLLSPCHIVAYSDPAAGEIGTIYQALNWFYLGASQGGPTAALVDGKLITLRSFQRDRNYEVGKSLKSVAEAFPRSKVLPVGRKGRYVGVYGPPAFKRAATKRLQPFALPYPKRHAREAE